MLNKDPKKRPSVKRILEKEFLAERIANLIPMSIVKQELGNTFAKYQASKNKAESDSNNNYNSNSSLTHSNSSSKIKNKYEKDNTNEKERGERDVKLSYELHSGEDERVNIGRGLSRNSSQHSLPTKDVLQNKDININLDNKNNRDTPKLSQKDKESINSNRYKQS